MIETFNDLYDATYFIEMAAEEAKHDKVFFKAEITLLPDGRWRVGLLDEGQMEFKFETDT